MSKLSSEEIIKALKDYSILELNDLVKAIEQEFNISANFSVSSGNAVGAEQSSQQEQTEFALHLKDAGSNKIGVIKIVREMTGLGLMEAKKLADSAPVLIKEDIPAAEVESLKKKFSDVGATVEFK